MQNFVQKLKTTKYNRGLFLMLLFCWRPQFLFSQSDQTLSNQIIGDSAFVTSSERDSFVRHSVYKIDSNHRSRPIHPYFRDNYRVIQDLRRLVRMFDYPAVEGYESLSDLVDVCRKLPEPEQAEIIATAMAGGVVNLVSERANKELRKRNLDFFQWQLEKVFFRNRYKFLYLNLHTGVNSRGFVCSVPIARFYYYRYYSAYYSTEGVIIMLIRQIGINCSRYDGRLLMAPFYATGLGTFELTYDMKFKMMSSRVDLRKTSSLVIRAVHVHFLDGRYPDRLLSEVLIWW